MKRKQPQIEPLIPAPNPEEPWSPAHFFSRHPVFSLDALRDAYRAVGRNPDVARDAVAWHVAQGHLVSVRRGLYLQKGFWDPWAIGCHAAPDATLALDSALQLHLTPELDGDSAYDCTLFSTRRLQFTWNEIAYRSFPPPRGFATSLTQRHLASSGARVRMTRLEHTLIDVLERLELVDDLRALVSSFLSLPRLSRGDMTRAVFDRQPGPLTCARLGFLLSLNDATPTEVLRDLQQKGLRAPAYFHRAGRVDERAQGMVPRWNLIVPEWLYALWLEGPKRSAR